MRDGDFSTANAVPAARVAAALLAVVVAAGADTALAKSQTVKIEIAGETLAAPIAITDRAILKRFHIWHGPSVRVLDDDGRPVPSESQVQEGMFIDWPRGEATQRPEGLPRYQVAFHLERESRRYVVSYELDHATGRGYFYLPRRSEPDGRGNTSLIYHGVEGRWFYASADWDRLIGSETLRHLDRNGSIRSRSQSRAVLYQ